MSTHPDTSSAGLVRTLALAALFTPTSGCCTLARLMCGPDRSTWVSERYDSPARTLATFQESMRRADPQTLLRCLSEALKAREGGIGSLSIEVLWARLSKQTIGLHLLGSAEVAGPTRRPDGRVEYLLSIAGRSIRLTLVRQVYWEYRWCDPEDPDALDEDGAYERSDAKLEVSSEGTGARLIARLPEVSGPSSIDQLTFAGIGSAWKVDAIEPIESSTSPTFEPQGY